jgi:hypothetical protein
MLQTLIEVTEKSEIYSSSSCTTLRWYSIHPGFKTRGTRGNMHLTLQEGAHTYHCHRYRMTCCVFTSLSIRGTCNRMGQTVVAGSL